MRVHQQVLGLKVPIVNGVMEALEKSSLELTLVTKVIDNQFYNVSNFLH
jgi:flagellar hook-basal body complex protein FliE